MEWNVGQVSFDTRVWLGWGLGMGKHSKQGQLGYLGGWWNQRGGQEEAGQLADHKYLGDQCQNPGSLCRRRDEAGKRAFWPALLE